MSGAARVTTIASSPRRESSPAGPVSTTSPSPTPPGPRGCPPPELGWVGGPLPPSGSSGSPALWCHPWDHCPLCTVALHTWHVLGFELFFGGAGWCAQGLGSAPMGGRCEGEILPTPGPAASQPITLQAHGRCCSPSAGFGVASLLGLLQRLFPSTPWMWGPLLGVHPPSAIPSTPIPWASFPQQNPAVFGGTLQR